MPVPHRSEDRLDDDVAHLPHGGHRRRRVLADDRLRSRQPGFLQQRGRIELVHRSLDRARRVDHRHAAFLQPVQRIDAEDDLLERSVRNDPRQHRIASSIRESVGRTCDRLPESAPMPGAQSIRRRRRPRCGRARPALDTVRRCASRSARSGSRRAPADQLSKSEARSTSALTRPAWNVRPLAALVSHTSAGLNSIGSIL